MSFWLCLKFF